MFHSGVGFWSYKRLERLARGKHSSLLQKLVNCRQKKFYNIDTWSQQQQDWILNLKIVKTMSNFVHRLWAGNTKGGIITVPLTSCLTGFLFANKNKYCQLSYSWFQTSQNRRSMVQWYFPLLYSLYWVIPFSHWVIFWHLSLSDACLCHKKLVQFANEQFLNYLLQLSSFLELWCASLSYDRGH